MGCGASAVDIGQPIGISIFYDYLNFLCTWPENFNTQALFSLRRLLGKKHWIMKEVRQFD